MTFAEKLRQLRQSAGLSEAGLAERSGVSFGAIHNYCLGLRRPTFRAALQIARALGVSCHTFADCDDLGAGPSDDPPAPPAPRRGQRPPGKGARPRRRAGKRE
jgi:transcriptional regulator with XRE-family HTH domain